MWEITARLFLIRPDLKSAFILSKYVSGIFFENRVK